LALSSAKIGAEDGSNVKPIFSDGPLEETYPPIAMPETERRKEEHDAGVGVGVVVCVCTVVWVAISEARRVDVRVVTSEAICVRVDVVNNVDVVVRVRVVVWFWMEVWMEVRGRIKVDVVVSRDVFVVSTTSVGVVVDVLVCVR
jgi:hypothetical protein